MDSSSSQQIANISSQLYSTEVQQTLQNIEEDEEEEMVPLELNNDDIIDTLTNTSEGPLLIFFFHSSFLHFLPSLAERLEHHCMLFGTPLSGVRPIRPPLSTFVWPEDQL